MNMKKVLIIGYFWPYIIGGGRIIELANHLHHFGWKPIILTTPLSQEINDHKFKVVEVPFKGDIFEVWRKIFIKILKVSTKRSISVQIKEKIGISNRKSYLDFLFNTYREVFGYPDTEKGWKSPALQSARKIIEEEQIDAIISTYPMISHIIAEELRKVYRIPWIADFPDLWSQNHNYPYGRIRKWFDEKVEIKTLKYADVLTTVSQPWANKLKLIHKHEKIYSITHGFDPKIVNHPPTPLSNKFIITYTGRIYAEMQDPEPFFAAIKELILEEVIDSAKLEIRFYGDREPWLQILIEKYNLTHIVRLYDRLQKSSIVEKQRESQLLLLLG